MLGFKGREILTDKLGGGLLGWVLWDGLLPWGWLTDFFVLPILFETDASCCSVFPDIQ